MPSAEEIQILRLQVEGAEKLDRLNTELQKESGWMTNLVLQLNNGAINTNQYTVQSGAAAVKVLALREQIEETTRAVNKLGGGGIGGVSGQGMLQLGYVMDDLVNTSGNWQRHLSSISNNMPGLLMALGAGTGLAGTIGLIYTAFVGLAPVATSAWNAVFDPDVDKRTAELKKVEEHVKKITDAYQKLREAKTGAEETGAKSIKDLITETGVDNLQRAMLRGLLANHAGETELPGEREPTWAESMMEFLPGEETLTQKIQKRIKTRIDAANQAKIEQILVDSQEGGTKGANASAVFRSLVTADPGSYPAGFLGDLENARPENIKAQRKIEEEGEANTRAWEVKQKQKKEFADAMARTDREAAEIAREAEAKRAREAKEFAAAMAATDREAAEIAREAAAKQAQIKREEAEKKRAEANEERLRARQRKSAPVDAAAAKMTDFNVRNGGGLSDEQIQQAAAGAVAMVQRGANANDAMTETFLRQLEMMQRLGERLTAQQNRLLQINGRASQMQMGPDFNGQFTFTPPLFGN